MDIESIMNMVQQSGMLNHAAANAGASPSDTRNVTQATLEHAQDGGGIEGMVDSVAQRAGVDPAIVNQVLPHILPLIQSHLVSVEGAQGAAGPGEGLAGMLGGLLNRA